MDMFEDTGRNRRFHMYNGSPLRMREDESGRNPGANARRDTSPGVVASEIDESVHRLLSDGHFEAARQSGGRRQRAYTRRKSGQVHPEGCRTRTKATSSPKRTRGEGRCGGGELTGRSRQGLVPAPGASAKASSGFFVPRIGRKSGSPLHRPKRCCNLYLTHT